MNKIEKELKNFLDMPISVTILLSAIVGGIAYHFGNNIEESYERAKLIGVYNDINEIQEISSPRDYDADGNFDVNVFYEDGRIMRYYGSCFERKEDVSERE